MVPGRSALHGSLGTAPEVVLFETDGHGLVLCPDSSHDGPDPLCQCSAAGKPPVSGRISVSNYSQGTFCSDLMWDVKIQN